MARYCTAAELAIYGVRSEALRSISEDDQNSAIDAASDEIDGYFGARYTLPLIAWESDLRKQCARLAVYQLMVVRGFNTLRAGDEQLVEQQELALSWLKGVSNGSIVPRVTDSSTGAVPGKVSGGVMVSSYGSRGYSQPDGYNVPFTGRRS